MCIPCSLVAKYRQSQYLWMVESYDVCADFYVVPQLKSFSLRHSRHKLHVIHRVVNGVADKRQVQRSTTFEDVWNRNCDGKNFSL